MTAPSKAEELWEKYAAEFSGECRLMTEESFLAALREYGAAVRARDAEICSNEWANTQYPRGANYCAAAISREPLP